MVHGYWGFLGIGDFEYGLSEGIFRVWGAGGPRYMRGTFYAVVMRWGLLVIGCVLRGFGGAFV